MQSDSDEEAGLQPPCESGEHALLQPSDGPAKLMFLHPSSLIFDLIAHGRTYLVPIALGLFGAANGDLFWVMLSAIFFVPAVLVSVFRYVTLRYRFEDDHLIVDQGLIFRKTRTVPVSRIQNIDLVQNVLHRIFGVAEVKIETASGTEPEATLRVLSMSQLELLRESVFQIKREEQVGRSLPVESNAGDAVSNESLGFPTDDRVGQDSAIGLDSELDTEFSTAARGAQPELVLSVPSKLLLQAGLASNRGVLMVGVALGAYYQFFGGATSITQLFKWFPKFDSIESTILAIGVGLIGGAIVLRLLSIAWYILRFFGYRLERRGDDLRISCGLLTRVSATIPRQRIQFISIHRPFMMRWMGLASIRIETAGGSGEEQNATESVSKRWFVPVVAESEVAKIVGVLRPGLNWDESQLTYQPLAKRAFWRMARLSILLSIVLMAGGLIFFRPWGFAPGLLALPIMLLWSRKQSRSMRYSRTDQFVAFRSGVLNRIISMTFFEKIQTLQVVQSPFDRRWGMATLAVDTAAAGPAEHQIAVKYLDASFAMEEFQRLREKSGQSNWIQSQTPGR